MYFSISSSANNGTSPEPAWREEARNLYPGTNVDEDVKRIEKWAREKKGEEPTRSLILNTLKKNPPGKIKQTGGRARSTRNSRIIGAANESLVGQYAGIGAVATTRAAPTEFKEENVDPAKIRAIEEELARRKARKAAREAVQAAGSCGQIR